MNVTLANRGGVLVQGPWPKPQPKPAEPCTDDLTILATMVVGLFRTCPADATDAELFLRLHDHGWLGYDEIRRLGDTAVRTFRALVQERQGAQPIQGGAR